jgi:hypothetical protein
MINNVLQNTVTKTVRLYAQKNDCYVYNDNIITIIIIISPHNFKTAEFL